MIHLKKFENYESDEYGNIVAYKNGDYKITLSSEEDPSCITLFYKGKKVGLFTNSKFFKDGKNYLRVNSIRIDGTVHRGKGLGKMMYKALLNSISDKYEGIISYLPDRSNKSRIPAIYKSLGGYTDGGDYAYIPKPKKLNEMVGQSFEEFFKDKIDWKFFNYIVDCITEFSDVGHFGFIGAYIYNDFFKSFEKIYVERYNGYNGEHELKYSNEIMNKNDYEGYNNHGILYKYSVRDKKENKEHTMEMLNMVSKRLYGKCEIVTNFKRENSNPEVITVKPI